jgi:ribonuclease HI
MGAIIAGPDGHVTELGGGARLTTNNQRELPGAIAALSALEPTSP